MKSPLTRRRERRILEALRAFGPLDNYQLAGFLDTSYASLQKPLLNLAQAQQVTASAQPSLLGGYFIWSIPDQDNGDE